jgi:hypothetical protein
MDGVDNDGDMGGTGRQAPKDACLGTVGVDHVGAEPAHEAHQTEEGSKVPARVDFPPHLRQDVHGDVVLGGAVKEFPFRAEGRTGDESHLHPRRPKQTFDGEEGVLLGATQDEPGDDVQHSHR